MKKETRTNNSPVEIRADQNAIKVSGYAAVFNEETDIGGIFREKIAPGAFKNAIGRDDVVFVINHAGLPLARTRSGTLTLKEDDRGLFISSELDSEDPDVRAIVPKMKRGDLDKMSFAFLPTRQEWDDSGDIPIRTVLEAQLFDVSIVTTPAYEGTDIGLRSLEQFREQKQGNKTRIAKMKMRSKLAEKTN